MPKHHYSANFTNPFEESNKSTPGTFYFDKAFSRPSDEFVISRTIEERTLSKYGDDIWDLRPYRTVNYGGARIYFSFAEDAVKEDAKWLMFLLLFIADSGRATGLAIGTVMGYWNIVRKLAQHSMKMTISIQDILENENELIRFVSSINGRDKLLNLSAIFFHLLAITSEKSGYHLPRAAKFEIVSKKLKSTSKNEQFPVIPPRIYFNLIQQLDSFISEIYSHKGQLFRFLERVLESEKFGRHIGTQYHLGYSAKNREPAFKEACELYGLDGLFMKYGVKTIPTFNTLLNRIQHACKLQFLIFTGMRHGEVSSLKVGALRSVKCNTGESYKFIGETSKLVGQKKIVSWITSKDVEKAYRIENKLARVTGKYIGIKECDTPLFIAVSYLCLNNKFKYNGLEFRVASGSWKYKEVYELFDSAKFRIRESDLMYLEQVNPFRAWGSENAFALGSVWRFTPHQFRRSLAFYVGQSALVSLPTLKRQLKHICREMTLYYCHTKTLPDEYCMEGHISGFIKREKPEADAIAYIHHVLQTDEQLFGAHGKFVERNVKKSTQDVVLKQDRDDLINRFKNGEIAYKETPLGACTTITPCDKMAFRNITACIRCERAIIKPSKLERVIARQSLFVKELEQMDSNSVEYRTEMSELKGLERYRNKISPRADS